MSNVQQSGSSIQPRNLTVRMHDQPLTVERNNFVNKALSSWAMNPCLGCLHGCRFCYVSDTSANKQAPLLKSFGVEDPIGEWGGYLLPRPFSKAKFLRSLSKAEVTPLADLNADGNRAIMVSSTTDPYQVISGSEKDRAFNDHMKFMIREALMLTREHSTLNVRILTRSPLARRDFDIMKSFGSRLMLGMSIPTLKSKILKLYEPGAPHPMRRLETLIAAHKERIPTYVAIAPVFPECDERDLRQTMEAVKEAAPMTVFFEPINIRLGVAQRIEAEARAQGLKVDISPFRATDTWAPYALEKLRMAEKVAAEVGLADRLHLWPDKALKGKSVVALQDDAGAYVQWLERWWNRRSEWPDASWEGRYE